MVQDRVQPLYSMASSLAHDSFLQEANTISYVHLLMSRAWRHLDVTHVPLVIQVRDLFFIKSQKIIFFSLKQCVFLDFRGCEGSGACFERLRMRSRSRRKCAHRNAGDLGSSLTVCACVYDPIHVTAQGKSLGPNCACVQPPRHYRGLPMNACVLYPMGSREFSWPNMGIVTSIGSHDLYARFWLVEKSIAALWLVTPQRGHIDYS